MKKNNNIKPTGLKGNETVDRMKSLMGIKPSINETKQGSVVELTKMGPDGLVYGIVRENHKYFIKTATNKENLTVEDFKYIGGLKNLNEGSYPSYSKAAKQLNLKFISINESLGFSKMVNVLKNDNLISEEFVSYSEPTKPSQPDTTLGTVKTVGKNDGHDKEIIGDAGETGGDGKTPPVVEEDAIEEDTETVTEEDAIEEDIVRGKGHDKELVNTTPPNTGDIEGQTAPIVLEDEAIEEEVVEEEDALEEVKLNENEKAIDKIINDIKRSENPKIVNENKLSILTALQKINEGANSKKKKI